MHDQNIMMTNYYSCFLFNFLPAVTCRVYGRSATRAVKLHCSCHRGTHSSQNRSYRPIVSLSKPPLHAASHPPASPGFVGHTVRGRVNAAYFNPTERVAPFERSRN